MIPGALFVFGAFFHPSRSPLRPRASASRHAPALLADEDPFARLILVRHGQSEWNKANRFTGWVDVDLTQQGIAEAREAGKLLAAEGIETDVIHTSFLRRAIRSAYLMLSTLDQCWVPVRKHIGLNEQHSGFLTGQNKRELAQQFGVDQVMAWRRQYNETPPAISTPSGLQLAISSDVRYEGTPVPETESLETVCERVKPIWKDALLPALRAGKTVMVVGHGNTLRALVKLVDGVSGEDSYCLDLPTATPLVYEYDETISHLRAHGYWGDREAAPRHGRYLVDDDRVRAAQDAMRQQAVEDIASPGLLTKAMEDGRIAEAAFTAPAATASVEEIDGESYAVVQRPPSYFERNFEEEVVPEGASMPEGASSRNSQAEKLSERLKEQAYDELESFRLSKSYRIPGKEGTKTPVRIALVLLRHGQSETFRRQPKRQ